MVCDCLYTRPRPGAQPEAGRDYTRLRLLSSSGTVTRVTSPDSHMMMEDMALNYSRQDLELLVSEAERLVMPPRGLTTCADHHDGRRCGDQYDGSSDSDYETRASREWLVRSEPNISLRHHQGSDPMVTSTPSDEARRRPRRRSVTNRRPDWRLSLPECLEYYQPPGLTTDHGVHDDGTAREVPHSHGGGAVVDAEALKRHDYMEPKTKKIRIETDNLEEHHTCDGQDIDGFY